MKGSLTMESSETQANKRMMGQNPVRQGQQDKEPQERESLLLP